MTMELRKAERRRVKLRIGIEGPSGSGKTISALLLAMGLGDRVAIGDTERNSADKYADHKLLQGREYDVVDLQPPYEVPKYLNALNLFARSGIDVGILDSTSHLWAGEGGLLDKQGKLEASGKFRNSFATWREITPEYNSFVEGVLNSPIHVIATMRSKTEYVVEKDEKGKSAPRKVGLAPIQREGLEYEFDIVFSLAPDTNVASVSKDRTGLFHGKFFKITMETGRELRAWCESGAQPLAKPTIEEKLGDNIPEFAPPKGEVTIAMRAKTMGEIIDHTATVEELDREVLAHIKTMDDMAKEKPDWNTKMLEKIEARRVAIINAVKPKKPRTKREPDVADTTELNDEMPPMTDAERAMEALK